MITSHATLAPSSAPQWGYCSGSVMANANAPDIVAERAREGTASHWVGEQALLSFIQHAADAVTECTNWLGETAPNGVVIDEEMCEGAQVWVDDVIRVSREHGPVPNGIAVEERVTMPQIHPENWGTLDARLWQPARNTLYVWDYKYGRREVTAPGNLQLIDYVAGLREQLALGPDCKVVMKVIQPFCYHSLSEITTWAKTIEELQPYFDQLTRKAREAMTAPTMTAGVHCRDCAAISRCATAKRAGYSVMTYASEPYDISIMSGPDQAAEREILREGLTLIKARLEAIEDELYAAIAKGDKSSGLTLENKLGRLAWSDVGPEAAILMAASFGADIAKPGVMTPAQAIKAVPAGPQRAAFEAFLPTISKRPVTGMKLVPVGDSRTARAFSNQRSKK